MSLKNHKYSHIFLSVQKWNSQFSSKVVDLKGGDYEGYYPLKPYTVQSG
jgi:hypothetical protein